MEISGINNHSFKGLWGKTELKKGSMGQNEQYNYYPFKDESQERTNEYVETYSDIYSSTKDGHFYVFKKSVIVQAPLDFTKQEFLTYKKVQKVIEENNLREYFNY